MALKKLSITALCLALTFSMSITCFAEGVRYTNELTVTPVRIFFCILVVALFVISEFLFEKIREKRVANRNKSYDKKNK